MSPIKQENSIPETAYHTGRLLRRGAHSAAPRNDINPGSLFADSLNIRHRDPGAIRHAFSYPSDRLVPTFGDGDGVISPYLHGDAGHEPWHRQDDS